MLYYNVKDTFSERDLDEIASTSEEIGYVELAYGILNRANAIKLADAVSHNSAIKHCYFSCLNWQNNLNEEKEDESFLPRDGFSAFISDLKQGQLQTLCLSNNTFTESSLQALIEFLSKNPQLKSLRLSDCSLSAEFIGKVCNALLTKTAIAELDISHNAINEDNCKILSDVLVQVSTLKKLNLNSTNLTSDGLLILADAFNSKKNLEVLGLGNNKFSNTAVATFFNKSIEFGTAFKELQLQDNKINVDLITNLIEKMPSLVELHVERVFETQGDREIIRKLVLGNNKLQLKVSFGRPLSNLFIEHPKPSPPQLPANAQNTDTGKGVWDWMLHKISK